MGRRWLAVVHVVMLLVVVGCRSNDTGAPEPPAAGWPGSLSDFTVTWTAEPGIDLTKGAAVAARAYLESYYLAYLTDDEKYLYPGFRQVVDANAPEGPDGTNELWPTPDSPETWIGTLRHHVLRIEQSGRDSAVVACVYSYGTAVVTDDGFEANVGGPGAYAGINAVRIGLQAPDTDGAMLPPRQGPARAPVENVFGGWRVTNHQGGFLMLAHWPGNASDKEKCLSLVEGPPESRTFIVGADYPKSAFPTLPAAPGWPNPANQ